MPGPDALAERLNAVLRVVYLVFTQGHRAARTRPDGSLVLLGDQDRMLCDKAEIAEGEKLVESALRSGRPGPYQLHALIAACHSTATSAQETDWREIAALYRELARHEPTAVVLANQAVAVAMAESPESGLAILDRLAEEGRLERWPQLHIARQSCCAALAAAQRLRLHTSSRSRRACRPPSVTSSPREWRKRVRAKP